MSLTICTVVYNEERNLSTIEHNIRLLWETAPSVRFLLIDNASTDQSPLALRVLSAKYGIRHIQRAQNHLPQARQQALQLSLTKWVGFIDADCRIDEDWVSNMGQRILEVAGPVAAFGGPWQITGERSALYQGLFSSFLGHFGNCYLRNQFQKSYVDHLPTANVFYSLEHVLLVGGFSSPHPHVGEDLDLSYRLRRHGLKIEFNPKLKIQHQLPTSLRAWCAKMFLYGTARGEVLSRYKKINSYKSMVPLLFLPIFLLAGYFSTHLFLGVLAFYLLSCFFCSLNWRKLRLCLQIFLWMLATHTFYGFGIYYGCKISLQASLKKRLAQWRHRGPAWEEKST